MEWMSSRRGMAHLLDPLAEDRPGVVRAWPGLGVELHRARAQLWVGDTVDCAVVERLVRDCSVGARLDGEAVVLAGDEHPAGRALHDGMVRAAVAERQLVRAHAGGEREQLVAEADAEHGRAAEQLADGLHLAL